MTHQALIIIDVQNDYFENGKMELFQPNLALNNILQLEQVFQQNNWPIIYIQHVQSSNPESFFYNGTEGVELHSNLAKPNQENRFSLIKHFPNSFFQTKLDALLKRFGVQKVVITGMMTHMCVDATTRAALELGYETVVIADATATRNLSYMDVEVAAQDVQRAFLSALSMLTSIRTTDEYLNLIIES